MNFKLHNVGGAVKKDSWEECSHHCNDEPKCFAWSYYTEQTQNPLNHKNCHMKDADFKDGQTTLIGLISGIKGCGEGKCIKIS